MATQTPQQPNGEELEKLVRDYQMLQEQLRAMALQLDQLQSQKIDLEKAKEEVGKSTGKVYVTIGGVIVETSKEKALAEIGERAEFNGARMQSTNKQFTELKAKEKQMNERLSQIYKQGGAV